MRQFRIFHVQFSGQERTAVVVVWYEVIDEKLAGISGSIMLHQLCSFLIVCLRLIKVEPVKGRIVCITFARYLCMQNVIVWPDLIAIDLVLS